MEITFNSATTDGFTRPMSGSLFLVYRNNWAHAFVAHTITGGYAISHLPTGQHVEDYATSQGAPLTLDEAVSGFRTQIEVGATDLGGVVEKTAEFEVVNPDWQEQVQKRAEGVRSFTEMSTVHLRPEHLQVISNLIVSEEWESGFSGSTGVVVWRGYKDSRFCPGVLKNILIQLDTDYVLFDRDAPTHSRFPEFSDLWD